MADAKELRIRAENGQLELGRLHSPDDRDKNFPMRATLDGSIERDYKYWWSSGYWGDQGYTPQCVGYAASHWLSAGTVTQGEDVDPRTHIENPTQLYREAQKRDEWPGTNYDGTSVRGVMKYLQELGYVQHYYWAANADEVAEAVLTLGPVIIGVPWTTKMFYPDDNDMIWFDGAIIGGHALLVDGYNHGETRGESKVFRLKNSWGRGWGNQGFGYIRMDQLDELLGHYGEACIGREVAV